MSGNFEGFPSVLPEFLLRLRFNNTLEKLEENKAEYKRVIIEPLKALHAALIPVIIDIGDEFEMKPSRCISSMYTDRRFSPQSPLKEYMYLRFKSLGKEHDIPGFYFDMGMEYYSYGLRIYDQTSSGMAAMRELISRHQKKFDLALDGVKGKGFTIMGEMYKKDHYKFLEDSVAKDLVNHKNFYIGKDEHLSEVVFTNELANELSRGFLQLKEIFLLLCK